MFFFKKKYPLEAKYQKMDLVNFYYRGELRFGWIYNAIAGKDGSITYTMQIGGQCPALLFNIPETDITGIKTE